MRTVTIVSALCALLAGAPGQGWCARALSDAEMDQVTAGTLSAGVNDGKLSFLLDGGKGDRLSVEGNATVAAAGNVSAGPPSYIIMRDNAQSNLQSLVNVTAVNSKVQVLINLTVNINSTVGAIYQTNSVPGL